MLWVGSIRSETILADFGWLWAGYPRGGGCEFGFLVGGWVLVQQPCPPLLRGR